jgi:hypothetical protein
MNIRRSIELILQDFILDKDQLIECLNLIDSELKERFENYD